MSDGFPSDYDNPYQPYNPFGSSGFMPGDLALMGYRMFNPAGFAGFSGSFNSPYATLQKQNSAGVRDEMYRRLLTGAGAYERDRMAGVLAAMPNTMTAAGGQMYAPWQQRAYAAAAQSMTGFLAPTLTQSYTGRTALDAIAGGNSMINTTSALALVQKQMTDPFSMNPAMSEGSLGRIARNVHEGLFGQGRLNSRFGMQGYSARDLQEMVAYAANDGSLVDGNLDYDLLSDRSFMRAVRRGRISQGQLEKMGVGNLSEIDMSQGLPAETRRLVEESTSGRIQSRMREMAAVRKAMEELIGPDSGLVKTQADMLRLIDNFTQNYKQQMGGYKIEEVLRTTRNILSDHGFGATEVSSLQQYIQGTFDREGYSGAATAYAMPQIAARYAGLKMSGNLDSQAYGAYNLNELTRQATQDLAAYGKSDMASARAVILRRAQDLNYQFADNEQGRRLAKVVRNLESGAAIGDVGYANATAYEMLTMASQGFGGGDDLSRMMIEMQYGKLNEQTIQENGLSQYMIRDQQREFVNRTGALAANRALVGLGGGNLSSELQQGIGRRLSETFLGMSAAQIADKGVAREQFGTVIYDALKAAAATGDQAAQASLNAMGSTEQERLDAASVYGAQYYNEIYGQTGGQPLNVLNRIGYDVSAQSEQQLRRGKVRAYVDRMLANANNTSLNDSLNGLIQYMGDREPGAPLTAKDISGLLNSALKTTADPTTSAQLESAVAKLQQLQAELDSFEGSGDPADAAFKDELRRKKAAVADSEKWIKGMLEDRLAAEEKAAEKEAKDAGESATTDEQSSQAGAGAVTMNNPTFVFDNVTLEIEGSGGNKSHPKTTGMV